MLMVVVSTVWLVDSPRVDVVDVVDVVWCHVLMVELWLMVCECGGCGVVWCGVVGATKGFDVVDDVDDVSGNGFGVI